MPHAKSNSKSAVVKDFLVSLECPLKPKALVYKSATQNSKKWVNNQDFSLDFFSLLTVLKADLCNTFNKLHFTLWHHLYRHIVHYHTIHSSVFTIECHCSAECGVCCHQWQHCAQRRYLSYTEDNFEVFHPTGVTSWTDEGEIWHGGVDRRSPPCQISPPQMQR